LTLRLKSFKWLNGINEREEKNKEKKDLASFETDLRSFLRKEFLNF
jgi:uncharacterized protein YnzC (UPF0291/DUF896 family)